MADRNRELVPDNWSLVRERALRCYMEHGCMAYAELAPRRQQFHVPPAMPAL